MSPREARDLVRAFRASLNVVPAPRRPAAPTGNGRAKRKWLPKGGGYIRESVEGWVAHHLHGATPEALAQAWAKKPGQKAYRDMAIYRLRRVPQWLTTGPLVTEAGLRQAMMKKTPKKK
jgi:hypothetical protein